MATREEAEFTYVRHKGFAGNAARYLEVPGGRLYQLALDSESDEVGIYSWTQPVFVPEADSRLHAEFARKQRICELASDLTSLSITVVATDTSDQAGKLFSQLRDAVHHWETSDD